MEIEELQPILEAIIYAADDPVRPEQLKEIFPDESYDKIETALQKLTEEFNARTGGMWIREIAGGFRMTTRPEHHEYVRAYLKTKPGAKLSLAALETLAVIAYKQPVTLAEILAIRGKSRRLPSIPCSRRSWLSSWIGRHTSVARFCMAPPRNSWSILDSGIYQNFPHWKSSLKWQASSSGPAWRQKRNGCKRSSPGQALLRAAKRSC